MSVQGEPGGDLRIYVAEFNLGETVYLRVAGERRPGIITCISFYPGSELYQISWGDRSDSRHYALELTREYVPDFGQSED